MAIIFFLVMELWKKGEIKGLSSIPTILKKTIKFILNFNVNISDEREKDKLLILRTLDIDLKKIIPITNWTCL
jgi:hypothetical protein